MATIHKRINKLENTTRAKKTGFMAVYELDGKPGYFWDKKTDLVYSQAALDKLQAAGMTVFKVVRTTKVQGGDNRKLRGKS